MDQLTSTRWVITLFVEFLIFSKIAKALSVSRRRLAKNLQTLQGKEEQGSPLLLRSSSLRNHKLGPPEGRDQIDATEFREVARLFINRAEEAVNQGSRKSIWQKSSVAFRAAEPLLWSDESRFLLRCLCATRKR